MNTVTTPQSESTHGYISDKARYLTRLKSASKDRLEASQAIARLVKS